MIYFTKTGCVINNTNMEEDTMIYNGDIINGYRVTSIDIEDLLSKKWIIDEETRDWEYETYENTSAWLDDE